MVACLCSPKEYLRLRRLRLKEAEWTAAGLPYTKGKSLQRELLKSQTDELKQHVGASSSVVMRHVTEELSSIKAVLLPHEGETVAEAIARNKLEMAALRCMQAQDRQQRKKS